MKTRHDTNEPSANDNARAKQPVTTKTPRRHARRPAQAAPRRSLMRAWAPAILATFFFGCGPDFDPPSLVTRTRVVGARVEASGADDRASAAPGESATVTWLVTAPDAVPATLSWAFALCRPDPGGSLGCTTTPLALFQGTGNPPTAPIAVPAADVLAGATNLTLYGRVCDSGAPAFDPLTGNPTCSAGPGTTASVAIRVETPETINHNPTADHGFRFDGQDWPALAAGADPCATGPSVVAGTDDHFVEATTVGTERESYTVDAGDPPVPTAKREALQVSFFTTAGKLKTPFVFVEAADPALETPAAVKWTAPKAAAVTAPTPVTFTFVVRDGRGGTDWTTRDACVTPAN
jgi:hypothetical protein